MLQVVVIVIWQGPTSEYVERTCHWCLCVLLASDSASRQPTRSNTISVLNFRFYTSICSKLDWARPCELNDLGLSSTSTSQLVEATLSANLIPVVSPQASHVWFFIIKYVWCKRYFELAARATASKCSHIATKGRHKKSSEETRQEWTILIYFCFITDCLVLRRGHLARGLCADPV